jgi:hypothetical protein
MGDKNKIRFLDSQPEPIRWYTAEELQAMEDARVKREKEFPCPMCAAEKKLFGVGDKVFDVQDDRHIGTLEGVVFGYATVTWDETGWKSVVPRARLRHAEQE